MDCSSHICTAFFVRVETLTLRLYFFVFKYVASDGICLPYFCAWFSVAYLV